MRYVVLAVMAALLCVPAQASQQQAEELFPDPMEEAQEALAEEMAEAFSVFGDVFEVAPLTSEQEARLPAAARMTDVAFPEGTFAIIMEDSMTPMMEAMMAATVPASTVTLAEITGLDAEEFSGAGEEALSEALSVFDPHHETRSKAMSNLVLDLMDQMFAAIEPSYREALSRAFATRFEQAEMEQLLAFFETPVGAKYAKEAFLVQYDPQMMAVMEQMGPVMAEIVPAFMESVVEFAEKYPDPRSYSELSQAERARVALLLDRSEQELEASQPVETEYFDEPLEDNEA